MFAGSAKAGAYNRPTHSPPGYQATEHDKIAQIGAIRIEIG
jgi:hypothetical protein